MISSELNLKQILNKNVKYIFLIKIIFNLKLQLIKFKNKLNKLLIIFYHDFNEQVRNYNYYFGVFHLFFNLIQILL